MHLNSKFQVRFAGVLSGQFTVKIGVHRGPLLSRLLFVIVMEEESEDTKWCRKGDPREILCADDLVLTAKTKNEIDRMFRV